MRFFKKLLTITLISFSTLVVSDTSGITTESKIISLLDKSENYYWAALDNGGYKRLLVDSRKYLDKAKDLFENNKSNIKKDASIKIGLQIRSLSVDLQTQEKMYGKKFSTKYELTKFLGEPLIMSGGVINNHFFYYSPVTSTIKKGMSSVISLVSGAVEGDENSQFDVVILASEDQQSRVGYLAHAFDNTNDVFYTLTTRYINNILAQNASVDSTKAFLSGTLDKEAISVLSKELSDRQLLVISFDQMSAKPGDEFFNVYGDVYSNSGEKIHSIATMAFGFSHPGTLISLTFLNLLLLIGSVVVSFLVFKFWNYNKTFGFSTVILTSFYGFFLGRVTSWVSMPALSQFSPPTDKASYDSLPMLLFSIPSYLWLVAIALTIFVLPVLVPRLISHPFLKKYANLPSVSGKGAYFGIGAAHGVAAYIAFPLSVNIETYQLISLTPVYIALLLGGYILGRSLLDEKDKFSEKYSIPIIVGFITLAFPLLAGDFVIANSVALIVIVTSMYIIYQSVKLGLNNTSNSIVDDEVIYEGVTSSDVTKIAENPTYKKFSNYLTILNDAESQLFDSGNGCLAISGEKGSGKTATLKELILDINKKAKTKLKTQVLYFHGECKKFEEGDQATPYDVFYQALGTTLSLDLFDQRSQGDAINSAIGTASKILLGPVGAILSTESDGDTPSFSDDDIYAFIQDKLEELSKDSIIIFHLDDVQWLDKKSEELLRKLLAYFKNKDSKVLFLLGLREKGDNSLLLDNLKINNELVRSLNKLNAEDQKQLLIESIGLSPDSALWISSWLSQRDDGSIYPSDLVDAVDHLARNDHFVDTKNGYTLSKNFDKSNPPIPDGVKNAVYEILNKKEEDLNLISIAAYIGKEFTVSLVSKCLNISRLVAIEKLDKLSKDTGLIFDVLNKDDVYSFRSQAFLDAIRLNIGYTNHGSNVSTVAQSARNYHALIAKATQDIGASNLNDTMSIARHYFAAGSIYAKESMIANIKAAKLTIRFHQFDDAYSLLDKADMSATESKSDNQEVVIQKALLECEKSHIHGKGQSEAADGALSVIGNEITLENQNLAVTTARALYESRRFNEVIDLSEKLKKCTDIEIQAEGYHFHGLSEDLSNNDLRLSLLKKAYDIAIDSDQSSLIAMVANSLAGQLSKGDDKDRKKAIKLYHKSLKIKESQDIKYIKGMAMTHGGLGFFHFFGQPQDLANARVHFEKDLELAIQIGGEIGMSKMNSMLSQIDLLEDDTLSAAKRSIVVLNLNNNPFDTGKAVETLCKITSVELPKDFNLNEVNLCSYLKKISNAIADKNNFNGISEQIKTLLVDQCS